MMMKRIACFAALALVLVLSACKKEEISFNEEDLVGYWACTKSSSLANDLEEIPPYSFEVNKNHTGILYYKERTLFKGNWAINGANLELSGIGECPKTVIHKLDGKHMSWTQYMSETDVYEEEFINIPKILPGKWKIEWPDKWYLVEFDTEYCSFSLNGTETPVSGSWYIGVHDSPRPRYIYVNLKNTLYFDIRSASDDNILAEDTIKDVMVTMTRMSE